MPILDIRDKTNTMYSTVQRLHELQEDSKKGEHIPNFFLEVVLSLTALQTDKPTRFFDGSPLQSRQETSLMHWGDGLTIPGPGS